MIETEHKTFAKIMWQEVLTLKHQFVNCKNSVPQHEVAELSELCFYRA